MTETDPFARIRLPDSGEILEEHRFPLFEYTGLYQKLRVPAAGVQVESIVVSLEEAADSDTQYLLNLVVAPATSPKMPTSPSAKTALAATSIPISTSSRWKAEPPTPQKRRLLRRFL